MLYTDFLMSSTKVPPKCRWTEQHSGNNRIYFQWMHSRIEKKKGRADLKAEIFWIAMVTWTEHPRELSNPCWWKKSSSVREPCCFQLSQNRYLGITQEKILLIHQNVLTGLIICGKLLFFVMYFQNETTFLFRWYPLGHADY